MRGTDQIGDIDFGPDSHFDYDAAALAWYDHLFKGAQNEFGGKPVKIFVMGANQWREEDDWPLARAQATKYFLHSTGQGKFGAGEWHAVIGGAWRDGSVGSVCL